MLDVSLLLQLPNVDPVCSDHCAHAGTSMNLICRDSDFSAAPVLESRASFQAKLTMMDPRQNLEPLHRTRHNCLRRLAFPTHFSAQDEGTYMHGQGDDFASMLQWLMTALPLIHKTCLFSCRVKNSVISRSAPVAPLSRLKQCGTCSWTMQRVSNVHSSAMMYNTCRLVRS